jgi:hypothetical protein
MSGRNFKTRSVFFWDGSSVCQKKTITASQCLERKMRRGMVSEEAHALPGEASWAPLKNTAKQQGGQVKQGMLQCHTSPKVDGHPARRILHCKKPYQMHMLAGRKEKTCLLSATHVENTTNELKQVCLTSYCKV